MRIGSIALRHWALALDRLNVRVVRWRLGQDASAAVGLPDCGEPAALLPVPAPTAGPGVVQTWRDAGGDWVADRLGPVGRPPTAALILLHGWLATPAHLLYLRRRVAPLLRAGIEVWLPRLPAHIERTPAGSVSGVRCLAGSAASTARAIELAVHETVALGRWLQARVGRIAIWGISLGGWVAALAVTRDASWRAAVLWSPIADPRDALLQSPLALPLRDVRARAGDHQFELRAEHARLIPIECVPLVDRHDVLVISGINDNVARKSSIDRLCRRWQVTSLQLEHGHISQMMSRRAWRHARNFVAQRVFNRELERSARERHS